MQGTGHNAILLEVNEARCRACKHCPAGAVCRGSAFRVLDQGEPPFIDTSRCWDCLICVPACPFNAVVRHEYTPSTP